MAQFTLINSTSPNETNVFEEIILTECFILPTLETITSNFVQNCLIILYISTAGLALIGNVIVIAVQLYGREAIVQSIKKYLISLAVSDIILGVLCVPFTYTDFVYRQWIFAHWLCPLVQFAQLLGVFITSSSLSIIGIERYLATLHPLSSSFHWLQSHSNLIIAQTWIIGALYAYIPVRHTYLEQFELNNSTYFQCSHGNGQTQGAQNFYVIFNLIVTFVVPSAILTFSYFAIMKKLRSEEMNPTFVRYRACDNEKKDSSNQKSSQIKILVCNENRERLRNIKQIKSRSNVNKFNFPYYNDLNLSIFPNIKPIRTMLFIIVIFDICWFPIKLYQLLLEYEKIAYCTETQFRLFISAFIVCHWIAMASSFVNPVVYSFTSKAFRNDLQRIFIKLILICRSLEGGEDEDK